MIEVRFHGRGGQGVVTSAELLSVAAFAEGRWAQAFPTFGSERTGAPVAAYCRIDDREIRLREPVTEPAALVIGDATLLHQVDVFAGLRPDGCVLINTSRTIAELGIGEIAERIAPERLLTVPATELALRFTGRPIPNAVLLGGLAALGGFVSLGALESAIEARFGGDVARRNVEAAREAHRCVAGELRELSHA